MDADPPMSPKQPRLWIYLAVAIGLVLLGGAFAGLTIALMGQDEIYLQVIRTSGDGAEKKHAARVLRLLKRGKHWVLVTLLLGNVITNETLPIVLDRSLGGGWPAVLGSTVLIVIFGEIIPQSICVRYGLPIGAWMSPLVLVLMYILAPVAWPTAKLLDRLLGEDHGTTYKKAGLKTLVTLHKTLGSAGEQLNSDEVTIISAVLDLKEKSVGSIMTPMEDTFTMSADTVLDVETMDIILSAGYSRIPIYEPDKPSNFVGMLLVKILITYDPEDAKKVSDFALATLPETRAETSCLDIINFFQEGKSHMVLVSEFPGEDHGALGVVTLEDVTEELIGEEIIDESDVFIDVHKAIRRINPAPKTRVPKGEVVTDQAEEAATTEEGNLIDISEDSQPHRESLRRVATTDGGKGRWKPSRSESGTRTPPAVSSVRRNSSAAGSETLPRRLHGHGPDMRQQLKHLGPSNLASRPRQTRYNTVKIKPGGGTLSDGVAKLQGEAPSAQINSSGSGRAGGSGLVKSAGRDANDGVLAVQAGYGATDRTPPKTPRSAEMSKKHAQATPETIKRRPSTDESSRARSQSSVGSLPSRNGSRPRKNAARSGSITENIVDAGGFRKVVLEMTSSSEEINDGGEGSGSGQTDGVEDGKENGKPGDTSDTAQGNKKKRRRKRKKNGRSGEDTPLLDRDES
ncbi:Domain of unknown function DUF21 [Lasallia pustulata]|uniref:CNNM transmembrane domain-containing protein n=1 Tax=Lasallia pustulata TaxID=136370 RepID=A0A1W5DA73_9LECA|nr:Domain of unknown function DUF21 [Lasallia pustulata]